MRAKIIDGKAVAAQVRQRVAEEVAELGQRGIVPGLAVVLVGEDPASHVYVRSKSRACREVGITAFDHHLPGETDEAELLSLLYSLNRDPRVDGILVQLPLPQGLDAQKVLAAIDPQKDVDGLLPDNVGRLWLGRERFVPCTPLGVLELLRVNDTPLCGAEAVVVGRSNLVGRPMAALLLAQDATVTLCHSRTRHLEEVVRRADVLVAAIGKPEAIAGAWIKEGATVVDVGINRLPDGKLVGDVEFAAACARAAAITPVPGGVGPMTIAMLLSNTVLSARSRLA